MSLKRDSKETEVNNKVIERFFDNGQWKVTRYDNDRLKYTDSLKFESVVDACDAYDSFIDAEHEKMTHQF